MTTLLNFNGTDGALPIAGLIQGSDSNFYGTTADGGQFGAGAVFKITSKDVQTVVFSFNGTSQGGQPSGELVEGASGVFFGTTSSGGAGSTGTIFEVTSSGEYTRLFSFSVANGAAPYSGLILGFDGNFYGTTIRGGAKGLGTVFKVTADGALTTLHDFSGNDGASPVAGLVQGVDSNFYGTTSGGGRGSGTVFKITANGAFAILYEFSGGADGGDPAATLVQGQDGNLYGTTTEGGAGAGVLFQITPAGKFTVLHTFVSASDGGEPMGALIQGSDGNFYGTTVSGGTSGFGTVFQLIHPCTFSISPSHLILGAAGNDGTISITASSTNCSWTAASAVSWITLTGATNGFGSGVVAYSVLGNTGAVSRTGTITIAGATFTVSQQAEVFGQFFQGAYNGLVQQTGTTTAAGSGAISLNFGKTGAYTASLTVGGVRQPLRGQFDMSGNATNTVSIKNQGTLTVVLQVLPATNGTDQIIGTVSLGTNFTSDLLADLATFGTVNPCPFAGQYTLVLEPADTNDVTVPQGFGYGKLTVTTVGGGSLKGVLGDGTAIRVVAPVAADGSWPLYQALYKNQGCAIGFVSINTNGSVGAAIDWLKPPVSPKDHFYQAGFTTSVTLTGAVYVAPSAGGPTVAGSDTLTLGSGNLTNNIVAAVTISSNGAVTVSDPNTEKLTMKVTPSTGQFSGKFKDATLNKTFKFAGVLLQNDGSGDGFFAGTNRTGFVTLEPAP